MSAPHIRAYAFSNIESFSQAHQAAFSTAHSDPYTASICITHREAQSSTDTVSIIDPDSRPHHLSLELQQPPDRRQLDASTTRARRHHLAPRQ